MPTRCASRKIDGSAGFPQEVAGDVTQPPQSQHGVNPGATSPNERLCRGSRESQAEGARVARASNPRGATAMWVRDRPDSLWHDGDFDAWYPRDGRPGLTGLCATGGSPVRGSDVGVRRRHARRGGVRGGGGDLRRRRRELHHHHRRRAHRAAGAPAHPSASRCPAAEWRGHGDAAQLEEAARRLARNPCRSSTVGPPAAAPGRVDAWAPERVPAARQWRNGAVLPLPTPGGRTGSDAQCQRGPTDAAAPLPDLCSPRSGRGAVFAGQMSRKISICAPTELRRSARSS